MGGNFVRFIALMFGSVSLVACTNGFQAVDKGDQFLGSSQGDVVPVPSLGPVQKISTCASITRSGNYQLSADLKAADGNTSCLEFTGIDGVNLDCAGHTVAGLGTSGGAFNPMGLSIVGSLAIQIEQVKNFTLQNCTLLGKNAILSVTNSTAVTIQNNNIGAATGLSSQSLDLVAIGFSDHIIFNGNILQAEYTQVHTTNSTISGNSITAPRYGRPELNDPFVLFSGFGGSGNQFLNNQIDGMAQVVNGNEVGGADDAIFLIDETHSIIQGNKLNNVYDLSIESIGTISNCTFKSNTADQAALGFIGGWYWSNFIDNMVDSNTVSNTPHLFYFYRYWGLIPTGNVMAAQSAIMFSGNTFSNNTLVPSAAANATDSPIFIPLYASDFWEGIHGAVSSGQGLNGFGVADVYWWKAPTEIAPTPSQFNLSNNTFTNNDFGTSSKPLNFVQGNSWSVYGLTNVIDGGGNKCAPDSVNSAHYPIHCN